MDEKTVRLVPMTEALYHRFFREYAHDPDLLLPGQPYRQYTYSEEAVARYVRRQKDLRRISLAILWGEELAGEILFKEIQAGKCATLSIVLKNASYKDRGIGTAAERLAVRYAFETLDLPTLYADAIRSNTRSQHVLEKAGFVRIREDPDFRYYRIERDAGR